MDAIELQKKYYTDTASKYDTLQGDNNEEHTIALLFLSSMIQFYNIQSILDVGSGTGRVIQFIKEHHPHVRIVGIEPVEALRQQAYQKGINPTQLIDGDANNIQFKDQEFDLVCEFGMLHHVPAPHKVVGEMLRVARKAIFISDCNNFGQGSRWSRLFKQTLNALHLWKLFDWARTKGKGYHISEGDGLFYSYSVFTNYPQIRKKCSFVHHLNTRDSEHNLYRTAQTIALLGILK